MELRDSCLAIVLLCLVSISSTPIAAVAADLPGDWIEVRSEHFTVISNARPKDARKVAVHFEQIRQVLGQAMPQFAAASGPPLRVFAPANERSMGKLFPIRWSQRGRTRPAGLFSDSVSDQYIVLRADLVGGENFGLVYHEYFHYLASEAGFDLPTWASEGLADFWGGGTRLTKKDAEVARPLAYRLNPLTEGIPIPLEELLAADRSSDYYRNRYKATDFYAQSWALTHFIMLGDETGELKKQLIQYFLLLDQGKPSLEAAREAFGDLEVLERKLRSYTRSLLLSYFRLPLPPEPKPESLKERDLSQGEAAARVVRHLHGGFASDDLEGLVELAMRDVPDLAVTREAQGIFHMRQGETAESAKAFGQAAAAPDASALAHYGRAVMRFHQARQEGDLTPELLGEIESSLVSSLQADSHFAPAASRLAEVYRRLDGGEARRALVAIRRAIALEPDQTDYRLIEARILQEAGQADEARIIVEREADAMASQSAGRQNNLCWQGAIWGFAEMILPSCDLAVEQQPESASYLDSRGVARALAGDAAGALADLEAALAGAESWTEEMASTRKAWIASLKEGKNPFAENGYQALADDPLHEGVGWLR